MTTDREALVKRIQDAIRCAQDETSPALILSAKSCRELLAALSAQGGGHVGTIGHVSHGKPSIAAAILSMQNGEQSDTARVPREPTLEECFAAGYGPLQNAGEFREGGLPNTQEERARFEAYMRGHCWEIGSYDSEKRCYDSTLVRMLYGVWRDRGGLAAAKEGK